MSDTNGDFRIPDPQDGAARIGEQGADAAATLAIDTGGLEGLFATGLTTTDLIITGVVIVVLAGIMLLPRKVLITSLSAQFADFSRAKAAGNALYVLLLALGAATTVGLLGNLWTALRFVAPAAGLLLVLFIVFIVSYRGARTSRVGR